MNFNENTVKVNNRISLINWSNPIGRLAFLIHLIFYLAMITIVVFMVTMAEYNQGTEHLVSMNTIEIASGWVLILLTVAFLASAARRLVDMGLSRWWLLLYVAPLIQPLVTLWLLVYPGRIYKQSLRLKNSDIDNSYNVV